MKINDYFEQIDDQDMSVLLDKKGHISGRFLNKHQQKNANSIHSFISEQDDSRKNFKFSYKAARFEEGWLLKSLGGFYEHRWISDVLWRVKGGKEASVYLCKAGVEVMDDLAAVKVYRPRSLRNLKNDHIYREGRANLDSEGKLILNHGMEHAMAKRTEYGKNLLHQSWIAHEFTFMQKLKALGADVPTPFEMADNAILMSFVGDMEGCAPTLNEVSLTKKESNSLFERLLWNIELFLSQGFIHGDLSAYNILFWQNQITLIDFPQVISPEDNRNAFQIFHRDITRVCDYFSKQGVKCNPGKISVSLWEKHGLNIAPEVDIRLLDEDYPADLKIV